MKRRLLRAVKDRRLQLVAAALGLLALVGAGFVSRVESDGVATFEVRPGRFVREVEARGSLKAVKATPILVPPESGRQQKVAFLAKDGAFVKTGETVVEFDPYDAQREAADGQADLTRQVAVLDRQIRRLEKLTADVLDVSHHRTGRSLLQRLIHICMTVEAVTLQRHEQIPIDRPWPPFGWQHARFKSYIAN
jgi:multidrug efflux pump subunit AcrA (membrane-fusion protein)